MKEDYTWYEIILIITAIICINLAIYWVFGG